MSLRALASSLPSDLAVSALKPETWKMAMPSWRSAVTETGTIRLRVAATVIGRSCCGRCTVIVTRVSIRPRSRCWICLRSSPAVG